MPVIPTEQFSIRSPSELPRVAGSSVPVDLRHADKLRRKRAYQWRFPADEDERASNDVMTLRRNSYFDASENGYSIVVVAVDCTLK